MSDLQDCDTHSHQPVPGPDYWSWRCLVCSEPVDNHEPWWRRMFHKIGGAQ